MKAYQWSTYVIEKECGFKHESFWSLREFQVNKWSKGAKAYQRRSLTLKQCHMALDGVHRSVGRVFCVCVLGNIIAIVLSENICPFFLHRWSCKKHTKWRAGTRPLWWEKAKGWDWPFGHQLGFGNTMHGSSSFWPFPLPPPRLLWAMLTSQRLTPQTSMIFYKDSKHTYGPSSPPPAFISHAGTHACTRTKQFCLCICKQVSPVWHHSTTAGYGSIKRPQISADYIKTNPWHRPHYQMLFSFSGELN